MPTKPRVSGARHSARQAVRVHDICALSTRLRVTSCLFHLPASPAAATITAMLAKLKFSLAPLLALYKKECADYLNSPSTAVFLLFFLLACGILPFSVGQFFFRNQSDLQSFFVPLPWIFLLFIPALTMRTWAEERRLGTLELLLTLPISIPQAVLAKTKACATLLFIALTLTFPLWITITLLGNPDHGAIAAGYLGALMLAGAQISIGCFVSATTRNQTTAFVVTVAIIATLTLLGSHTAAQILGTMFNDNIQRAIQSLSMSAHYKGFLRGVVSLGDVVYFLSVSVTAFFLTVLAVAKAPQRS